VAFVTARARAPWQDSPRAVPPGIDRSRRPGMREDVFVRYLTVALLLVSSLAMLPIAALASGAGS
jgi:hypothetical protein